MKNSRSLFVNWTRPRTLRCSTVNCCLSAAFSASSRLLDLKSEETRFKNRKISPTIVADVKRFSHQIKRTKFSAHTAIARKAFDRKTGARGLRSIMEGILLDTMFDLPSLEGVEEVVISKEVVEGTARPARR